MNNLSEENLQVISQIWDTQDCVLRLTPEPIQLQRHRSMPTQTLLPKVVRPATPNPCNNDIPPPPKLYRSV